MEDLLNWIIAVREFTPVARCSLAAHSSRTALPHTHTHTHIMDDMTCDDFSTTIKCVVLGNGMVGKSTLAKLFCQGIFTDTYKKTIGVDFMEKQFEVEELAETVHMMIWDTAGQEEFNSLTTRYYKGAGAAVLVFSTTDREVRTGSVCVMQCVWCSV